MRPHQRKLQAARRALALALDDLTVIAGHGDDPTRARNAVIKAARALLPLILTGTDYAAIDRTLAKRKAARKGPVVDAEQIVLPGVKASQLATRSPVPVTADEAARIVSDGHPLSDLIAGTYAGSRGERWAREGTPRLPFAGVDDPHPTVSRSLKRRALAVYVCQGEGCGARVFEVADARTASTAGAWVLVDLEPVRHELHELPRNTISMRRDGPHLVETTDPPSGNTKAPPEAWTTWRVHTCAPSRVPPAIARSVTPCTKCGAPQGARFDTDGNRDDAGELCAKCADRATVGTRSTRARAR